MKSGLDDNAGRLNHVSDKKSPNEKPKNENGRNFGAKIAKLDTLVEMEKMKQPEVQLQALVPNIEPKPKLLKGSKTKDASPKLKISSP